VTDRRRALASTDVTAGTRCLVQQASFAIEAGIDFIQIRDRDLPAALLVRLVSEVVALARGSATRVLVNDRLDVALASGAAGVHLRSDSIGTREARAIAPPGFLIGRSVHDINDLAAVEGADYLIAGTVWPSFSKASTDPLLGIAGLSAIANATAAPVMAIGGVNLDNLAAVRSSGASGIAAIGLFLGDERQRHCRAVPLAGIVQAVRAAFATSG
jgi:thiamine-phosphate pyrophosphorylase